MVGGLPGLGLTRYPPPCPPGGGMVDSPAFAPQVSGTQSLVARRRDRHGGGLARCRARCGGVADLLFACRKFMGRRRFGPKVGPPPVADLLGRWRTMRNGV